MIATVPVLVPDGGTNVDVMTDCVPEVSVMVVTCNGVPLTTVTVPPAVGSVVVNSDGEDPTATYEVVVVVVMIPIGGEVVKTMTV